MNPRFYLDMFSLDDMQSLCSLRLDWEVVLHQGSSRREALDGHLRVKKKKSNAQRCVCYGMYLTPCQRETPTRASTHLGSTHNE